MFNAKLNAKLTSLRVRRDESVERSGKRHRTEKQVNAISQAGLVERLVGRKATRPSHTLGSARHPNIRPEAIWPPVGTAGWGRQSCLGPRLYTWCGRFLRKGICLLPSGPTSPMLWQRMHARPARTAPIGPRWASADAAVGDGAVAVASPHTRRSG